MPKAVLLQPAYFAPIAQYAAILQTENIVFEIEDNFCKQTYRNRCIIFAANGLLTLNVPVKKIKGQKSKTINTEISYAEDWQSLHLKSLQSAYKNTPFYEYYEPEIIEIFKTKFTTLGELHNACHSFIMETLQEDRKVNYSEEYIVAPENIIDLRSWIDAKKTTNIKFDNYIQMFDEKHGFQPNLSILDLIFMEGPAAVLYLENLNLNIL